MRIYIASSWRNAAGVELLTAQLRKQGWTVDSWVENNYGENHNHVTKKFDFEEWVQSDESNQSFQYDTHGARSCDIFIYYGPAGMDACAELGLCYGAQYSVNDSEKTRIIGLRAKGDGLGLMRRMVAHWFDRPDELLRFCAAYAKFFLDKVK